MDPSGCAWWHWAIAAGIVVGIGAALVLTAGGAAPALVALTQVAYGFAVSSMATTVLAGAFIGSSIALGATAMYAMSNANSLDEFAEQGNWGTVAVAATGGLIGAGTGYLNFANYGYTQYGDKTLVKSYPFGSYHNAKESSVTHYGINGKMLWSKHFTDHGNFGKFFHNNPHWHTELPHSKGYNTLWEFLKALAEKIF
ncbi:MAG: hypothetical protein PHX62_03990 [Bacilli bacterium]|nr:hypothetical protein [Bacilli bacterium]